MQTHSLPYILWLAFVACFFACVSQQAVLVPRQNQPESVQRPYIPYEAQTNDALSYQNEVKPSQDGDNRVDTARTNDALDSQNEVNPSKDGDNLVDTESNSASTQPVQLAGDAASANNLESQQGHKEELPPVDVQSDADDKYAETVEEAEKDPFNDFLSRKQQRTFITKWSPQLVEEDGGAQCQIFYFSLRPPTYDNQNRADISELINNRESQSGISTWNVDITADLISAQEQVEEGHTFISVLWHNADTQPYTVVVERFVEDADLKNDSPEAAFEINIPLNDQRGKRVCFDAPANYQWALQIKSPVTYTSNVAGAAGHDMAHLDNATGGSGSTSQVDSSPN